MSFSETISPFIGRCALVWFYVAGALNIFHNWGHVTALMDARHVPVPPAVLLVALVFILLGSVSLLFGYHTRHGAVLLFGLTITAAVMLHPFWRQTDAAARAAEFEIFSRDIAICGGLLMIVGMGAGPFAADNRSAGGGGGAPKGKRR